VFALRAAAVFMIAGTTRALRAGLFPRWFAMLSYLLAVTLVLTVAEVRAVRWSSRCGSACRAS
jgi:hypothetical protein